MSMYRILSLDGGGLRGIITSIVLGRLDKEVPGWRDKIEFMAGTSTGGLIAMGLAYGMTPDDLCDFYVTKGPKIFDDSWLDNLFDIGKVVGADYGNEKLRYELRRVFKDTTLGELDKQVLIPSFDLDNQKPNKSKRMWKPKLFHNFDAEGSDSHLPAYLVGLYTSAAPTYFPSVDGFIDGGVYANNPSMCALAQTQDERNIASPPALGDIVILSLGTGTSLKYLPGKKLDWGFGQWARPLIEIMMDGVVGIADYQCKQILGENYHRFGPFFEPGTSIPLDAVKRIPDMIKFAKAQDLSETITWLKETWMV